MIIPKYSIHVWKLLPDLVDFNKIVEDYEPIVSEKEIGRIRRAEVAPRIEGKELAGRIGDLEGLYMDILRMKGYKTERNVDLGAISGELDVIGFKDEEAVVVECKNKDDPMSIEEMRIFHSRITDAPRAQEFEGKNLSFLAVARFGFTDDSKGFANEHGIIGLALDKDGYKIIGKDEVGKAVYYDRDHAKHIIK